MPRFDFRSDTVTVPTDGMKEAMFIAPVGDDVYGEDITVNQLEAKVAKLAGFDSAIFCVSGTMTNQIGIRLHLEALDEVICDADSHIINFECGGIHYHSRAAVNAVVRKGDYITAEEIEAKIRLDHHSFHQPTTKLIALENTLGGIVLPLEEIAKIHSLAKKHNIRMHLDGARLWNACVATGHSLADYCQYFDTVSLCLSKGLGAPIGSILLTTSALCSKARHFRKLFGGGWRQAGILAAGGIYSIDHHWTRMKEDHDNAKILEEVPHLAYRSPRYLRILSATIPSSL